MALAFSLEAVAILILFAFIDRPVLFVVLTGLVFFGWGEIFSVVPLDADGHLRLKIRGDQLRLSLYRPRHRLYPGRTGSGVPQADDRKLDDCVHHCRRASTRSDRDIGDHRTAEPAAKAFCRRLTGADSRPPAGLTVRRFTPKYGALRGSKGPAWCFATRGLHRRFGG